jgi:hypothetical protein
VHRPRRPRHEAQGWNLKHHARCKGERTDGHCDCPFLDVISGLAAQLAESHAAHLESSRAWDREVKLTRATALEEAAKVADSACDRWGQAYEVGAKTAGEAIRALAGQPPRGAAADASAPRLYTLDQVQRAVSAVAPYEFTDAWWVKFRDALTEGK